MASLAWVIICSSDIDRCQESTSSPAVSNSISEGIIEEEEDEEVAEESNKKRMKEDDQEVFLISLFFIFQILKNNSLRLLISSPQSQKESFFTWRVDLSKTEKYWEGWFRGLSSLFLSCPAPKLLLLAGESFAKEL